jgi:lysophospholipid acyltransferase (LPLAT)-like uncharacterized protein
MRFLSLVAACFIRAVVATLRIQLSLGEEYSALVKKGEPVLFAFWHGRFFLFIHSFRDTGLAINTDVSWAGGLSARVLTRFGYSAVPGSSARKGAKALIAMRKQIASGHSVAVAPDGPSGPRVKSKPGVLTLARTIGCPIVPAATSARPAWVISQTWDRFMIPAPFARCAIVMGKPIYPGEAGQDLSLELLDRAIDETTAKADRLVGRCVSA